MQQQITRGDYLKDLITIYIENNLQQGLDDLYSMFVFQCGEIQKQLTPAQVIKISFTEQESQLLTNYNTCYLAGITKDGHKETFNGSISFNTRGEVVYYEPTPNGSLQASTTSTIACPCTGISGVFANCTQPAIKAYFSINYVPTKLSELTNDTDFVDSVDVAESISIHNASTEAHPYIQGLISDEASVRASETEALGIRIDEEVSVRASQTEALSISIGAETTAREEAVSLAITTTKAYADSIVQGATTAINTTIGDLSQLDTSVKSSVTSAINAEVSARQSADNDLQTQIDGLAAASDVTDIVGTYAELQAYDTQHLNDNDIIKVLSDSTHEDEPSYYRFDKETDTFSYIGSESAAYTKAQSDSIFVTQTTEINGHALTSDINLTPSDVGALPSTTTINDLTSSAQQAALNSGVTTTVVAQVGTNTTDISTINGKIPTDASSSNKLVSASTLAASIADFANQDLSNLTTTGEGRLHALKGYADKGELLTDPEGLQDVISYAHSTFDSSKFTVVGSPIITDDGIASGFSSGNYLYAPSIDFSTSSKVVIKGKFKTPATTPHTSNWVFAITTDNNVADNFIGLAVNTNLKIGGGIQVGGTNYTFGSTDYIVSLNTEYLFEYNLVWNGTSTFKLMSVNGTILETRTKNDIPVWSIALIPFIGIARWLLSNTYFNGSIDLKQFSITVDGEEVFNGNKTGIDTIKPDDYTVVGTPTISADGIVSGFSTSNYLSKSISVSATTTCKIISPKFKINDTTVANFPFFIGDQLDWGFRTTITSGGKLSSAIFINNENVFSQEVTPSTDNTYQTMMTWENNTYKLFISINNAEFTQLGTSCSSSTPPSFSSIKFGVNVSNANPFSGSIDLNAFKVYVDGNLVYQPCLKIPYTESKTGSKIVNSIYRPRVNDMAEQFGYANYYTLDETNNNFTLPQVELYGLIGQRTLRDSYRNGINYWELYSNRDLEQGGSCTSGVEVTFARPFADTNYVLSVPYSAKSSTAFTPTQTGDWIAKGKGLL